MIEEVPALRVTAVNDAPINRDGEYVIYWMIANRRTTWNFALQHAVRRAEELGVPLLVFEALRVAYRWASDRLHRFILDGMAVNADRCAAADIRHHGYVEREEGEGSGLLEALAERACTVVTDEFPCFFLPRMVAAAGRTLGVRVEQVDGNGLLPLRASEKAAYSAYIFRRHLQKELPDHLDASPRARPLTAAKKLGKAVIPRDVLQRWPAVTASELARPGTALLASLPIDHEVRPVELVGGSDAAEAAMKRFLEHRLSDYGDQRNQPEADATSGLSPYLHFGHLSTHQVMAELAKREQWSPESLASTCDGKRAGWWGMSASAEAFADQIVTWRELGYSFCFHRPDDYDRFESLPDWARDTLLAHAGDCREHEYGLEDFEHARTHDDLWNAAQRQLVREGTIHNYLRMLWGKKILEWSATPEEALAVMIELNNKYALDGRNPNSYSGIFWTLGRFDRPWAPERPIFGQVRYMSSKNTARKVKVKAYVQAHSSSGLFSSS